MRRFLTMIVLLTATLTAACADELPAQRPPDLRVQYNFDGGMYPRYYQLRIVGAEGRYEARHRRRKTAFTFTLTGSQLDGLWQVLHRNRFGEIGVRDGGKVYDRGGVTITVAWKERRIRVSDSGNMFVEKRWRAEFSRVRAALDAIIAAEKKRRGLPLK